jgi:CTP synthase (UTP-ammonia lyase)
MRHTIGLVGDRDDTVTAHRAIPRALDLAADVLGVEIDVEWIGTEAVDPSAPDLSRFSGLWCVPASPYRSGAGAVAAIRYAREHGVPFLGTCGGFQHALLEVAQSLWGVETARHAETDPSAADPVVAPLECSLVEASGAVHFLPGSRFAEAYRAVTATEAYHCSYGLNPRYRHHLEEGPLRMTSWDDDGDVRGVELDGHPFFVATLFQSERRALRGEVPPLVAAFVAAVAC